MGTLHYLDDLKVREGKAGAEVHGTMVIQDTLCLEKAVTVAMGTVSAGEWSRCAWIEPLQQCRFSYLSSVQWEQEAASVWGAGVENEGLSI